VRDAYSANTHEQFASDASVS